MRNTAPALILASTSPRRIDLLNQAGLSPLVVGPGTDEASVRGESPRAMVARLAREKADAVAVKWRSGEIGGAYASLSAAMIIAADTTVVAPGGKRVLGKPKDEAEARKMLGQLAGKTHTVLTGYCLLEAMRTTDSKNRRARKPCVRVVTTQVTMRPLSKEEIAIYVRSGEPMDKAGAYAAQGIGMTLISGIRGSYTNVVGLPVAELLADLSQKFGFR